MTSAVQSNCGSHCRLNRQKRDSWTAKRAQTAQDKSQMFLSEDLSWRFRAVIFFAGLLCRFMRGYMLMVFSCSESTWNTPKIYISPKHFLQYCWCKGWKTVVGLSWSGNFCVIISCYNFILNIYFQNLKQRLVNMAEIVHNKTGFN